MVTRTPGGELRKEEEGKRNKRDGKRNNGEGIEIDDTRDLNCE